MNRDPDEPPPVISLESHRRRRQAEVRKAAQARKARTPSIAVPAGRRGGEKAINWSRAPRFAVVAILVLAFMWLVSRAGDLLNLIG